MELNDKYKQDRGTVYLTGIQALVRLPMAQMRRDRRSGLKTGAFICGYEGSPLGAYDMALARVIPLLQDHNIHLVEGQDETFAAAEVCGSQVFRVLGEPNFPGVLL